jgi:NADPH-dependent reductive aminase-like protein/6-phosphogluconate dehydrogenase-like protein
VDGASDGISVAIIGGGIGGLAASSLLRVGIDVHVYEQARELTEVGGGIQISPNASRILHRFGLADALANVGVRPLALHQRRWDDGRTLLRTLLAGTVTCERLLRSDGVTKGLRGKLLVQLTSGSPKQAREIAAWARQHEIQYLDGAIMATPNLIGGPECTILYSGPRNLFEKYQPVLLALLGNSVHVGSAVGNATALDSALLVVMWGALFGALQGVAICEAEELRLDAYMSYLRPVLAQVNGWVVDM